MLLGLLTLVLGSCGTDDFTDWAGLKTNAQEDAITIPGFTATSAGAIDLGNVTEDEVATFQLSTATLPADYELTNVRLELTPEGVEDATATEFTTTTAGVVATSDLQAFVEKYYGKAPVGRTFDGHVYADATKNGESALIDAGAITLVLTPKAPNISAAYYIIGGPNDWVESAKSKLIKFNHSEETVYDDPVFTVTFPMATNKKGEVQDTWFAIGDDAACQAIVDNKDYSKLLGTKVGNGKNAIGKEESLAVRSELSDDGSFMVPASSGATNVVVTINMLNETYTVNTINFKPYVYFIGSTDGWKSSEQRLALTDSQKGIYTGYVYIANGKEFKIQKTAGSWDDEVNAGNTTIESGLTGTDNFVAPEEGVYYITYDAGNKKITAVHITNMNLVGDFNGWNQADKAQQMKWNASEMCYEISNAGVTANGWKFTANNAWDINLGGNDSKEPTAKIDDLVGGGKNLNVVGKTIKLYPCRTKSGNIYCTVK